MEKLGVRVPNIIINQDLGRRGIRRPVMCPNCETPSISIDGTVVGQEITFHDLNDFHKCRNCNAVVKVKLTWDVTAEKVSTPTNGRDSL